MGTKTGIAPDPCVAEQRRKPPRENTLKNGGTKACRNTRKIVIKKSKKIGREKTGRENNGPSFGICMTHRTVFAGDHALVKNDLAEPGNVAAVDHHAAAGRDLRAPVVLRVAIASEVELRQPYLDTTQ